MLLSVANQGLKMPTDIHCPSSDRPRTGPEPSSEPGNTNVQRYPYNWNISIYRKHCQQINWNKHIHNFYRIVFLCVHFSQTWLSGPSAYTRTKEWFADYGPMINSIYWSLSRSQNTLSKERLSKWPMMMLTVILGKNGHFGRTLWSCNGHFDHTNGHFRKYRSFW